MGLASEPDLVVAVLLHLLHAQNFELRCWEEDWLI